MIRTGKKNRRVLSTPEHNKIKIHIKYSVLLQYPCNITIEIDSNTYQTWKSDAKRFNGILWSWNSTYWIEDMSTLPTLPRDIEVLLKLNSLMYWKAELKMQPKRQTLKLNMSDNFTVKNSFSSLDIIRWHGENLALEFDFKIYVLDSRKLRCCNTFLVSLILLSILSYVCKQNSGKTFH